MSHTKDGDTVRKVFNSLAMKRFDILDKGEKSQYYSERAGIYDLYKFVEYTIIDEYLKSNKEKIE